MILEFIGKKIKKIRKSKGISQAKLACIANVDRSYIAELENGKKNITILYLDKILYSLNITWEDFFKSENVDYNQQKMI